MDQDTGPRKLARNKNILDFFWKLCDKNTEIRLQACANILHALWKNQREVVNENSRDKDLQYCVERLIKGLASPREAARLGYTLLLTEILKKFDVVSVEEVLELLKKHLSISGKQEKKDLVFAQLFAYTAIIRSGRLLNHACLSEVIISLIDLSSSRNYIINATYEVILVMFSQLSMDNFSELWSAIKKKLPDDWETCSAQSLWLLLLCIRLFPDAVTAKYMKKHLGKDLFASGNLDNLKKIIKQTTSSLPMLHPTCMEFIFLSKQKENCGEIWNAVIDDLFNEQNEKSFLGFEMIKFTLECCPTEEMLAVVMSPKFRIVFSKSYLSPKHPLHPAASHLADFLCTFVKDKGVPSMQFTVLKAFLQVPGTLLVDEILKKKEVSSVIQNLLPNAVKELCDFLKTVVLKKKFHDDNQIEVNNIKRIQAIQQIANLTAHPAVLTDFDWRLDVIKFLFMHSFFTAKKSSTELLHCDNSFEPLTDVLRDSCMNALFKAVNLLSVKTDKQQSPLKGFLSQAMNLFDYAEALMNATESLEPKFSLEKVQNSWCQLRTILQKLKKKSKKEDVSSEINAFQVLFLQLALHLFQDPDEISEVLEELYICYKKAIGKHQQEDSVENGEIEPPWIGVVIDILLSLLSKPSNHIRSMVTQTFVLFCPFIEENALQQILDVINPKKDEDMIVEDGSGAEDEEDAEFESGNSSEESDNEENPPVDAELRKKVQEALGPAADDSEAESVVLSDSEMFKLDSALSEAFKTRVKSGHTQIKSEDKALLNLRIKCLDLILVYLKSDPPMKLALMCLEPVLSAFEFGHQSKHQAPLLHKAVTVLQFMKKIKKFQHHENVSKSELKRLLDILIPKCHKEIDLSIARNLSHLCVFIVLCYRKLKHPDSPDKKGKLKTPSYIKIYLSALETFVSTASSHMLPQFFTNLMEACPDLAWYFTDPLKNHAFNSNIRLFKRTQCLGLLSESLKYSRNQKEITDDQWLELVNSVFPVAIEGLKTALESDDIKPVYCTELFNIIYLLHLIMKEKMNQFVLEKYADLLPLLNNTSNKKLRGKGMSLKNKIITVLGGKVNSSKKMKSANETSNDNSQEENNEEKLVDQNENMDCNSEDVPANEVKKKKKDKKKKKLVSENSHLDSCSAINRIENITETIKSEISDEMIHKIDHLINQSKRKSSVSKESVVDSLSSDSPKLKKKKLKNKRQKIFTEETDLA